jgi:hypothetical protein
MHEGACDWLHDARRSTHRGLKKIKTQQIKHPSIRPTQRPAPWLAGWVAAGRVKRADVSHDQQAGFKQTSGAILLYTDGQSLTSWRSVLSDVVASSREQAEPFGSQRPWLTRPAGTAIHHQAEATPHALMQMQRLLVRGSYSHPRSVSPTTSGTSTVSLLAWPPRQTWEWTYRW